MGDMKDNTVNLTHSVERSAIHFDLVLNKTEVDLLKNGYKITIDNSFWELNVPVEELKVGINKGIHLNRLT